MSKFQIEKDYHRRKLAIIELIDLCSERIQREQSFIRNHGGLISWSNSRINIDRHKAIREYLIKRYNE